MDGREWFDTAGAGFLGVLTGIRTAHLERPGLGEWDVRSLLGHASRAFSTLETYLAAAREVEPPIALETPTDYFRAAAAVGLADPAAVTQRGRAAGIALGEHPVEIAGTIVERVTAIVSETPDHAAVSTPLGGMRLSAYLPTRAFEVTVHGIDLAHATGQDPPRQLVDCAPAAIALCAEIAQPDARLRILLALTGRRNLPEGFSVL